MNEQDIGAKIDETGWERGYVNILMQWVDIREAAAWDRAELREVVQELLLPFKPTDYELNQITNALAAKLRDHVPPADSPPQQSREDRLYRP